MCLKLWVLHFTLGQSVIHLLLTPLYPFECASSQAMQDESGAKSGNWLAEFVYVVSTSFSISFSYRVFRILKAPAVQTFATPKNCGLLIVVYSIQQF